jgi:hypothetical protein
LFLSQRKYAIDIISESGLLGAKPCDLPMEQNHQLPLAAGPVFDHLDRYRRLVGHLIYRPKLCYVFHTLAQFMQTPKEDHWNAPLRVIRYLKNHPSQGLVLSKDSDLRLTAYCDSDWATCPLTRRSITGYFIMLGASRFLGKLRNNQLFLGLLLKPNISMATTSCEIIWLKSLPKSLGVHHSMPMRLFCDSQAPLHIAANHVCHERTKHIEVDCHFVQDQIQAGNIVTFHVRTHEHLANIFTKAFGKQLL